MEAEKIDSLVARAVAANLDGLDFLSSYDYKEISAAYNGIGPEWLPDDIRKKISAYLDLFAPAALIHDMRYQHGDGSRYGFNFANMEFWGNCVKLANDAYPWYSLRRYGARIAAGALYDFVRSQAGWIAWSEASSKTLTTRRANES